ncbi:MAG: hypothetical protein IE909_02660 [Campylobacterales bacterium]|nr:hypothetical protein [Campylobacterales bacterium]
MKKLTFISIATAVSLYSVDIPVNSGWNLLGAVEDINLSGISCAGYVWGYDTSTQGWKLYTNTDLGYSDPSSYGYGANSISSIPQGKGFWLYSPSGGCSVSATSIQTPTTDLVCDYNYVASLGSVYFVSTDGSQIGVIEYYSDPNNHTRKFTMGSFTPSTSPSVESYTIADDHLSMSFSGGELGSYSIVVKQMNVDNKYNDITVNMGANSFDARIYYNQQDAQSYLDSLGSTTPSGTLPLLSDMNTTDVSTMSLYDFTRGIHTGADMNWFDEFNRSGTSMTVTDYDKYKGAWQPSDAKSFTFNVNSDKNASIYYASEGFGADIIVKGTKKVNTIGTQSFNDLFVSDIETHVTAAGSWTNTWDWTPTYWDGSTEVAITTNTALKEMLLTHNHWFSDDYAMLKGVSGDTSGNVVSGYWTGQYYSDCTKTTDNDCKIIQRSDSVIGSWTFNETSGISVDLPQERLTIHLNDNGYVEETGQDKVGSVWQEYMFTGSDATVTNFQQLLQQQ